MDKIIDYAGEIGLKVILDHHRNGAGISTTANGLWYDDKHSETDWVNDWVTLAQRYANNPTVIGADLHNEPYNGTWGGGGDQPTGRRAAERGRQRDPRRQPQPADHRRRRRRRTTTNTIGMAAI